MQNLYGTVCVCAASLFATARSEAAASSSVLEQVVQAAAVVSRQRECVLGANEARDARDSRWARVHYCTVLAAAAGRNRFATVFALVLPLSRLFGLTLDAIRAGASTILSS